MSLTLLGWLLIGFSLAMSALALLPLRSGGLKAGASWQELAVLARLRSSTRRSTQAPRRFGAWIIAAAVFLLVVIIGATTPYLPVLLDEPGAGETDGEVLQRLSDYTHSLGAGQPASAAADGKPLPDVGTMIAQLAARLETAPEDVDGWRMLGWSYFNTERYGDAVAAYAKAVALDPGSAELKRLHEQAKTRAGGTPSLSASSTSSPGEALKSAEPSRDQLPTAAAAPPNGDEATVRGMVDRLADRLAQSPRDAEGWTRLMRSRIVLGERDVAETAFRKALEVFKDDEAAAGRIKAEALELGLTPE